jgi:hypothetical protein
MTGIVEEIQRDAIDQAIPVSALLRKVKMAAVKLQLSESIEWVDAELNGYRKDIPDYRIVYGKLRAIHPLYGSLPLGGDASQIRRLSQRAISQSISSLESIIGSIPRVGESRNLSIDLPPEIVADLNRDNGTEGYEFSIEISRSSVISIIDRVRTLILDWAIDLERSGISGSAVSFSIEEKEKATSLNINIGHVHGTFNAGDVTGGRFNTSVESQDKSVHIDVNGDVFEVIRNILAERIGLNNDSKELFDVLDDMKNKKDTNEFLDLYRKFLSLAADHMTIVAPFLSPLSAFIPN